MEASHVRQVVDHEVAHCRRGRGNSDQTVESGDSLRKFGRADAVCNLLAHYTPECTRTYQLAVHRQSAVHALYCRQDTEADAAKAELTDLKIKLAAAVEASTVEKRKSFAAAKNAEAARAQLLKQITRADALAAGKASADAAAAHSKRVAERAKDAAHQRVSRAATEFARYRTAVEARLRDTAPPPPSAFERMGSASARHLRKKRVLSPGIHPRTPVATTRRGYGR